MKKKIRKIGMLSSIALMICLGVTGCYPDGKVSLEEIFLELTEDTKKKPEATEKEGEDK